MTILLATFPESAFLIMGCTVQNVLAEQTGGSGCPRLSMGQVVQHMPMADDLRERMD